VARAGLGVEVRKGTRVAGEGGEAILCEVQEMRRKEKVESRKRADRRALCMRRL
jgi:hypothetical protein